MTVYVLTARVAFSDDKIYTIGVAATEEKARVLIEEYRQENYYYDIEYDEFEVEE